MNSDWEDPEREYRFIFPTNKTQFLEDILYYSLTEDNVYKYMGIYKDTRLSFEEARDVVLNQVATNNMKRLMIIKFLLFPLTHNLH